jgi:hypothetical protein
MRRGTRIAVELLGPSLVASVLFVSAAAGATLSLEPLKMLPFLLFFAYLFAGVPSVLFTLVLEVSFARGLDPATWPAVRLAAVLGLTCGCALALLFSGGLRDPGEPYAIFPALGVATGAVVGAIVRARSRLRNEATPPHQQ